MTTPLRAALAAMFLLTLTMPLHAAENVAPPASDALVPVSLDQMITGAFACARCQSNATATGGFWRVEGRCGEEEMSDVSVLTLNEDGEPMGEAGRATTAAPFDDDRNCAECEPSCNSGGFMSGTEAEVAQWYAENRCNAWACSGEMRLEALAEPETLSAATLASMIEQSKGKLRFHHARGSVQLYGCDGQIKRNIPLATAVAADLASELARAADQH